MKKAAVILATAIAFGSGISAQPVMAATGMDKGVVKADSITVSATVEVIDYERRLIILKGPGDKTVTLKASKKVKYLDEIKKGDLVSAEYLDAVAIIVRKPDGKPRPGYLKDVTVTPRGKSDEGLPVDTSEAFGIVEATKVSAALASRGKTGEMFLRPRTNIRGRLRDEALDGSSRRWSWRGGHGVIVRGTIVRAETSNPGSHGHRERRDCAGDNRVRGDDWQDRCGEGVDTGRTLAALEDVPRAGGMCDRHTDEGGRRPGSVEG